MFDPGSATVTHAFPTVNRVVWAFQRRPGGHIRSRSLHIAAAGSWPVAPDRRAWEQFAAVALIGSSP